MSTETVIRCRECRFASVETVRGERVRVCDVRPNMRHITDADGWCYQAQRRATHER